MSTKHNEDNKLDQVLQLLLDASHDKKDDLKHYVTRLYERAKNAEEIAANKVKETAVTIDKSAHEKPWIYVGAAALGGFVVGLLCHRRS
jgi:ElaB/YqjD/DUF883 family membrane-anchored ribosome-binding protein